MTMLMDTAKFEAEYNNHFNALNEMDMVVAATGKPLSAEQQTAYANHKTKAEDAKKVIEHIKEHNARLNPTGNQQNGQFGNQQNGQQSNQQVHFGNSVPGEPKPKFGKQKEGFTEDPKCGFRSPEEFFKAAIDFGRMVHDGNAGQVNDPRVKYLSSMRAAQEPGSGFNNLATDDGEVAVTSDLTGSVFIPIEFAPDMFKTDAQIPSGAFKTSRRTTAAMQVTKKYRVDKDHRQSVTGGLQVGRQFEMLCNRSSAANHAEYTVNMAALYGAYVASDMMLQYNAGLIAQDIEAGFKTEFEANRIIEILNGNGSNGEYHGIWRSPSVIKVAPVNGASAGFTTGSTNLSKTDIYKMNERLWRGGNKSNAVWIAGLKYMTPLKMLQDTTNSTNNHFLFNSEGGPDWADGMLDGIPIVFTEFVPPMGYLGGLGLYNMAEFEEYSWKPMQMASSIHAKFICNQTVMKFWTYTGGRPRWNEAMIPKSLDADASNEVIALNTLSPFVLWDGDDAHKPAVNKPHAKGRSAAAA